MKLGPTDTEHELYGVLREIYQNARCARPSSDNVFEWTSAFIAGLCKRTLEGHGQSLSFNPRKDTMSKKPPPNDMAPIETTAIADRVIWMSNPPMLRFLDRRLPTGEVVRVLQEVDRIECDPYTRKATDRVLSWRDIAIVEEED